MTIFSFDRRQTWEISSDPFEYHCGKEDASEGQRMVKHKVIESLLEEENYEGLKGEREMVKHNH